MVGQLHKPSTHKEEALESENKRLRELCQIHGEGI